METHIENFLIQPFRSLQLLFRFGSFFICLGNMSIEMHKVDASSSWAQAPSLPRSCPWISVSPVTGTWMHQPTHAGRHSMNPPLTVLRHGGHPVKSPGSSTSTADSTWKCKILRGLQLHPSCWYI